jgi:hypothetical protein
LLGAQIRLVDLTSYERLVRVERFSADAGVGTTYNQKEDVGMARKDRDEQIRSTEDSLELYVVELDERLEFGAAIIDSDLQADDNTGCTNGNGCSATNHSSCSNTKNCG